MSIELVMPSNHLSLRHFFLLLPSIFPSIRVFSNESALRIRSPKYWSFSFSISPSNENSELISFRTDWLNLAVQGTLKGLLQHHSPKASVRQYSVFFMVQLSHLHMTTDKNQSFGYMYPCQQSDVSAFYVAMVRPRWLWLEHWKLSPTSYHSKTPEILICYSSKNIFPTFSACGGDCFPITVHALFPHLPTKCPDAFT